MTERNTDSTCPDCGRDNEGFEDQPCSDECPSVTDTVKDGDSLRDRLAQQFDTKEVALNNAATVALLGRPFPDETDAEALVAYGLEAAAKVSYMYADAMLAARGTPQPDPVREELVEALEALNEEIIDRRDSTQYGPADGPSAAGYKSGLQMAIGIVGAALSRAQEGTS